MDEKEYKLLHIIRNPELTDKDVEFQSQKYDFFYMKKKDFKKYREEKEEQDVVLHVRGWFRTSEIKEDEECDKIKVVLRDEDKAPRERYFEYREVEKEKKLRWKRIVGYVLMEDGSYAAIVKHRFIFLLWLLLLLGLLIGLRCCGHIELPDNPLKIENGVDIEDEYREAIVDMIDVPGFVDMEISNGDTVNLPNPEGNTVYFSYHLSENGKEFYSTDAIKPGEMVKANLGLPIGEHKVLIRIDTYDIETESTCNGANQEIVITVR